MAITSVRTASGTSAASTTTVSATLASGVAAGNLLIAAAAFDKSAGTVTPPSGYTQMFANNSSSVSIWVGYKIAAGGETTTTFTRSTSSVSGDAAWVGEFADSATGTWKILSSATNYTDESNVTSWGSGTAPDPAHACAAIAFFVIDTTDHASSSQSFSASYSTLKSWATSSPSGGQADVTVGWLSSFAGGSTTSTTHTHSPTADQVSGAVATFGRIVASGAATQAVTASTVASGHLTSVRDGATQAVTAGTVATAILHRPVFPAVRLPIKVELHLGSILGWVDVTDRTRGKDDPAITITRGRTGEGAITERSTCTVTFDNRTGDFSPRNPSGTWYGILGRNTPMRVTISEGGPYLSLAARGDYASCPDSAGISVTGDIDLRVDLYSFNWLASGDLIGKYDVTAPDRGYMLNMSGGTLSLIWASSPSVGISANSTIPVPMDGVGRLAVRATLDVDNGAGGYTVTFYTASTMDGPWFQLGDQVIGSGTTSIRDSARILQIGDVGPSVTSGFTGYDGPIPGHYYSAQVRSGIDGTIVADPSFVSQTNTTASFTDAQGNLWTMHGGASLATDHIRSCVEVPEWPQKWDLSGKDAWVTVQGAGILRRLGQGASPLASTLRRALTTLSPVAYWPCEEGQYATSIGSGVPAAQPMAVTTTTGLTKGRMAENTDLPASAALPTIEESVWAGPVPAYTATGQTQTRFVIKTPTEGTLALDLAVVARITGTGTVVRWDVQYGTVSTGSFRLVGYNSASTAVLTTGWLGSTANGSVIRLSVELTQSGSDIDWTLVTLKAGQSTGVFISGTLTGFTVGNVTAVEMNSTKQLGSTVIGHISVESTVSSIFDVADQLNAYLGETAGRRFERLCAENGIPFIVHGALNNTVAMGYQLPKTLLELLRQCADTDGGIMYEPRDQLALGYRTRASTERQNPLVSLSYPGHQLVSLDPVEDDLSTRNDVTITREGGTSARSVLTSGPLSVLPVPDGIGKYDTNVTLSLGSDDLVTAEAEWRLHLGTVDEARYPTMSVNMSNASIVASPATARDIIAADIGDRLVVNDPPMWVPPDPISQIIQGCTEKLAQFKHQITWNLSPESPYHVAVYGDPLSRYLPDGSTLAADATSTATSLSVATPSGPLWSHADGDFDIVVMGEQMTVNSIAGTTSPQTFTVTRSVNGVVKAHSTGEDVTLAFPVFYSL